MHHRVVKVGDYAQIRNVKGEEYPSFWYDMSWCPTNDRMKIPSVIREEILSLHYPKSLWRHLHGRKGQVVCVISPSCIVLKLLKPLEGKRFAVVDTSSLDFIPDDPDDNY